MKKLILVALFIVPTLLLIVLIAMRSSIAAKNSKLFPSDNSGLLTKWANGDFIQIQTNEDFRNSLSIANGKDYSALNALQKEKIMDSLYYFLTAFNTSQYDSYYRFRFPVTNGAFKESFITNVIRSLESRMPGNNFTSSSHFTIFKSYWENIVLDRKVDFFCIGCFSNINVQSIQIRMATLAGGGTNYLPKVILSGDNLGSLSTHSAFFEFSPSESELAKRSGGVLIAVVSLTIKEQSYPARPYFLQYYWVPEYKEWLPEVMGFTYDSPLAKRLPF